MYKKRLEDALNAAKTIRAGFNINESAKIKHLELLYRVNCIHKYFEVQNLKINKNDDVVDDVEEYENIQVLSLQFNQKANVLAAGDSNGRVQLFDVFSGKSLDEDNVHISQTTTIAAINVKWHPLMSNILYSANSNGAIMMYDRDKKKQNLLFKEDNETTCIDVDLLGDVLATAGSDHCIRLYDLTRTEIPLMQFYSSMDNQLTHFNDQNSVQLDLQAHSNKIFSIKFNPTQASIFYTGGWDRTVKCWDRRVKNGIVSTIYGPLICGDGIDLKDNFILTASWLKSNALQLWDSRKFEKPISSIALQDAHDGEYLYSAKYCDVKNSDNKKIIACGSGTKAVHLVDYEKLENMAVLQTSSPLYCVDAIYSGCIFASGSTKNFFIGLAKS